MSGAENALEGAILEALVGNADAAALLGDPLRVLDSASLRPPCSHLEIARHSCEARGGVVVEMSERRIDLVVVSGDLGSAEAKAAIAVVRGAIAAAAFAMEGWRCEVLTSLFSDATRERVGLWRALLRLKAVVEQI